jgi:hypothetical protein
MKELNSFTVILLNIGIIGSITHFARECISYNTFPKEYFAIFCTIGIIYLIACILGAVIILWNKNLIGYIILCVSTLFFNYIFSPILNSGLDYEIFDVQSQIIRNTVSLIVISLLLTLKKDGDSGFSVLYENYKNN